jgi:flagellar biosynthetic protein FliR
VNDALPLVALGIILVRPGVLIVATPVFGGAFTPAPVRIALTLALGVVLMPLVPMPAPTSVAGLALIVAGEAAVGLALAMSIRALIAGAELAGHVAGFQVGIGYAAIVDPQSGARNNVLSALYGTLATIVFLGINAHHALLRALARSYDILPPGNWQANTGLAEAATRLLGIVFLLGVQLAMPVIIVLLMVEVALGLVSRVAPALNLMVIGFPLRLGVGFLVLAVGIQVLPGAIARYVPAALDAAVRLAWAHR